MCASRVWAELVPVGCDVDGGNVAESSGVTRNGVADLGDRRSELVGGSGGWVEGHAGGLRCRRGCGWTSSSVVVAGLACTGRMTDGIIGRKGAFPRRFVAAVAQDV
jgi:hypothetical protein